MNKIKARSEDGTEYSIKDILNKYILIDEIYLHFDYSFNTDIPITILSICQPGIVKEHFRIYKTIINTFRFEIEFNKYKREITINKLLDINI